MTGFKVVMTGLKFAEIRFRDKNIPAIVDTASAATVVASDTNTVRTSVLR